MDEYQLPLQMRPLNHMITQWDTLHTLPSRAIVLYICALTASCHHIGVQSNCHFTEIHNCQNATYIIPNSLQVRELHVYDVICIRSISERINAHATLF